jgi:hypothetical protein
MAWGQYSPNGYGSETVHPVPRVKGKKTVFTNDMCGHVWAQQNQEYGRGSHGAIFFEGATIYSYGHHFPIARFVEHKGRKCVLFTTKRYGTTTGQHMSIARSSIPNDVPVFNVENVEEQNHKTNLKRFVELIEDQTATTTRSRSYFDHNVERLGELIEHANSYCKFFDLETRFPPVVFTPEFLAEKRAQEAKARAAKAAKTKAQAAEKRKQLSDAITLYRQGATAKQVGVFPYMLAQYLTDADILDHDKNLQAFQATIEQRWRAGERVRLDRWRDGGDLLRLRGDVIETSQAATFPITHGVKAFPMIAKVREAGEGWQTNGHTIPLGNFRINRIDPDGTVHAGCHTVHWPEIESCAKQLGLIP